MQVQVNGKRVRLNQADQLGSGGEGVVFRSQVGADELAVKVYHQPTKERGRKLAAFLAKSWKLPLAKVACPLHLVYDPTGVEIIGLTMPLFDRGFDELASLANRKNRASLLINTRRVAEIFIDGWSSLKTIHENGLVVGDFNDLNALYRGTQMLFIDVDAWQFERFPCPVATEQFLAPELYGIDLSLKPVFRPEHDWYSYAVMLFRSLLLVHPYGGTHKNIRQLTARAAARVTVFDKEVTYPKIALAPDVLDDDLAEVFERIFARGWREIFPIATLEHYFQSLTECKSCGTHYPTSRKQCPVCNARTIVVITTPSVVTKGVTVTDFIKTKGRIVFHKIISNTVYVIAYESGRAVLYTKHGSTQATRRELFPEMPGCRYEIIEQTLIVNQANSTELLLFDISGRQIKPLLKTETAIYAPNRRALFRASENHLFRMAAGSLLYGEIKNGRLIERLIRQVMSDQTWFAVKVADGDKPTACGLFQILGEQMFWLVWEGKSYDNLPVSKLDANESMIDLSVRFSSSSVIIRRLTQLKGVNYLRTDVLDENGKVVLSTPRVRESDHPAPYLHGSAYGNGKLLSATDEGIISEEVVVGAIKTFEATKNLVSENDSLWPFDGGIAVFSDSQVTHLKLG